MCACRRAPSVTSAVVERDRALRGLPDRPHCGLVLLLVLALTTLAAGDGNVTVKVRDTGEGIPEAVRDRLFTPFFTTKAPGKGTGLGLSVSYGIIQAHEGAITVESTPEIGTTFTILLPLYTETRK